MNVNKIFKASVSIASAVQFKNKRTTFILLECDYVSIKTWQEPCMVQEFSKKIVFSKVWEHFKGASKASWGIYVREIIWSCFTPKPEGQGQEEVPSEPNETRCHVERTA